jgi:hypothetical protein
MNYINLYEEWKALNEVGDAGGKPFAWKPEMSYRSYFDKAIKKAENEYKAGYTVDIDPCWYTIKGEKAEYRAQMACILKKRMPRLLMRKLNSPSSAPPPEKNYRAWALEGEFHFNTKGSDIEIETNLGEHFRLMTTLTQCVLDFINNASKFVLVKAIHINAKADDTPDAAKLDSRRGRLYLAYIKGNMNKLPGKWTAELTEEGVKLYNGEVSSNDPETQARFFYN